MSFPHITCELTCTNNTPAHSPRLSVMLSESESTARPLAERTDAELHAQLAHASKVVATVQAEIEQRATERLQLHAERREIAAMQKRLEAELDGRAAKHQRRGSGPSGAGPSTPRTARGRDAVDLDEEPGQCVVTMQMRKVELGTFDYGACHVAFTERAIRFYTNEAPRFQPKGYPEEIELEMSALAYIQIDKQRGLMCVTGSFEYAVPGHYHCISAANGPLSRALFHFDTSEGDGVWSGSYRAKRVNALLRLSPHIRNKSHFNPERIDFAAELQRFKRRQTSEKHVPKPPKPAAGRGRRAAR